MAAYGDLPPNYVTELKHAVAVWNDPNGTAHAYPLEGGFQPLSEPRIGTDWQFVGVLPAGCKVTEIEEVRRGIYRCTIGGRTVQTAGSVANR